MAAKENWNFDELLFFNGTPEWQKEMYIWTQSKSLREFWNAEFRKGSQHPEWAVWLLLTMADQDRSGWPTFWEIMEWWASMLNKLVYRPKVFGEGMVGAMEMTLERHREEAMDALCEAVAKRSVYFVNCPGGGGTPLDNALDNTTMGLVYRLADYSDDGIKFKAVRKSADRIASAVKYLRDSYIPSEEIWESLRKTFHIPLDQYRAR